MLRLRSCIVARLLSSPSASPIPFPPRRLLSAVAPAVSLSSGFAIKDYLVQTCSLTQDQALKASKKISHLKSASNPNAVLTFLAGLGLSTADVAALVAKHPKFLSASVQRTLDPIFVELSGLGVSHSEVARLVSLAPNRFCERSTATKLQYYLTLFGSYETLLRVLNHSSSVLGCSLEKLVKPNVAFLQECGLGACDIAKLCITSRWILGTKPERVREMAASAEALGVRRGSGMFRQALQSVALLSEEKIVIKVEHLKNTFRWSDDELRIALSKAPGLLRRSKESLEPRSEFLISEVGVEPAYIAHRPAMLAYSLEGRLRPRYYVVKFLKENGLLDRDRDYYSAVMLPEKVFVHKFICPHNEAATHLAEDYAAACRGEVPTRFKFA